MKMRPMATSKHWMSPTATRRTAGDDEAAPVDDEEAPLEGREAIAAAKARSHGAEGRGGGR